MLYSIFLVLSVSCRYSFFVNTAFLWSTVPHAVLTFSLLSFIKPYIYFLLSLNFCIIVCNLLYLPFSYLCLIYSVESGVSIVLFVFQEAPLLQAMPFGDIIIILDPESPLMFLVSVATVVSELVWSEIWCVCTHSQIFNVKLFKILLIIQIHQT